MFSRKREILTRYELTDNSIASIINTIKKEEDITFWFLSRDYEDNLNYLEGIADTLPNPRRMKHIIDQLNSAFAFKYDLYAAAQWEEVEEDED